ncbi:alpha/beta fold hydrolase [Occultella kanbiaonis]|uniref:alpha/beta fold hydrolase n=1 Tax=Occultella kanbiaonis TaxID=2675754 RepID=UPI00143CDE9D|nr:alpha/beta hydrolase [Occultella kanbiaonis]
MSTPSIIFVHGIRTSATMWRGQIELHEAAGRRVVAVDLPAHGKRMDEPFTLAGARAAIDEAVAELPGPHVVVGLSMGGYIALHWAARAERPPAAILAASCCTQPSGAALAGYRAVAGAIEALPDQGRFLGNTMARLTLSPDAARDVNAGGVPWGVMGQALTAMNEVDTLADLATIEAPIWFVNGAWDHFRTQERRFVAAAQYAQLCVVPGAGHLVSLDRPEAFARLTGLLVERTRLVTA